MNMNDPLDKIVELMKESEKVVDTMLTKPYADVVKFREACVQQVFTALAKHDLIDSELCVAMSYFVHCSEEALKSHPNSMGDVQQIVKGMSMDTESLEELQTLHGDAVANHEDTLVFRGNEVDVTYAKYIIEHLKNGIGDDDAIPFPRQ
jgi:hypothetical protein